MLGYEHVAAVGGDMVRRTLARLRPQAFRGGGSAPGDGSPVNHSRPATTRRLADWARRANLRGERPAGAAEGKVAERKAADGETAGHDAAGQSVAGAAAPPQPP